MTTAIIALIFTSFPVSKSLFGSSKQRSLLLDNLRCIDRVFWLTTCVFSLSLFKKVTFQPEFCVHKHEKPEGCHHPRQIWNRLTIHGLWPNNNDGSYPQNCSNERFDLSNLQPIREELEQKWPNIQAPSPDSESHVSFWEHEWSKHGTCSGLSQLDYFSHALKELIPTPSIVTDAEEQHAHVKKDDLIKAYGGDQLVALVCEKGYLSEVRVCHQKEADGNVGERMECPETILKESSCGSDIGIASFQTDDGEESAAVQLKNVVSGKNVSEHSR